MTHDPIKPFKPTNSEELASNPDQYALSTALERDARLFTARQKDDGRDASPSRRFVIIDLEFAYDRSGHQAYKTAEGRDAEEIRWPFHTIACACWMVMRFEVGRDVPVVEELNVVANDEANEREIAEGLFAVLDQYPEAVLLTWAGERKDLPVLRRVAARHDLLLPPQLRDPNIYCRERLDMCRAVSARASFPHLPEFAAATGVPCKPTPSKSVGPAVEQGIWLQVRDQCLADVLTTATIAVRHLNSHSKIRCHPQRSLAALAEAAIKVMPASLFCRHSFAPWARAGLAASKLKGLVRQPA